MNIIIRAHYIAFHRLKITRKCYIIMNRAEIIRLYLCIRCGQRKMSQVLQVLDIFKIWILHIFEFF